MTDDVVSRMQCETVQGGLHGNALIAQTAKKMWRQGRFMPFYRKSQSNPGDLINKVLMHPQVALEWVSPACFRTRP